MGAYRDWGKRTLDSAAAAVGLILLSPVIAITALCVAAFLGRPALFRQVRPGWKGRPFRILKFRTMSDKRGPDGQQLPDGERVGRFGRFLRATSLDELPELWNVLRGDMSLVGPRPLLVEYLPLYDERQRRRHDVRPGITGWAQVNGRNELSWEQRFEMDVWYVENVRFVVDARILLRTLTSVLRRSGIEFAGTPEGARFGGTTQR